MPVHDSLTPTCMHVCVAAQRIRCGKPDLSFYHVGSGIELRLSGLTASALTPPRAIFPALKFYFGEKIKLGYLREHMIHLFFCFTN